MELWKECLSGMGRDGMRYVIISYMRMEKNGGRLVICIGKKFRKVYVG